MLRVTVRLHKKLLMWLWVGFVRLEVNIWLQADHMDQDPLQHVVDDFFFFFYLFTIQTDAVAVLSSLHSSQTTHIWWSVSELRCWFFWIFFFVLFHFQSCWSTIEICVTRIVCGKRNIKKKKRKWRISNILQPTAFTVSDLLLILWKSPGRCFPQQPWICITPLTCISEDCRHSQHRAHAFFSQLHFCRHFLCEMLKCCVRPWPVDFL